MIVINSIEKVFEDFKFFFKDNNIPVYYASGEERNCLEHDHNYMDIGEIKKFIIAIKPNYIQLNLDKFEIDNELNPQLLKGFEESYVERFQELSSELKSINNSLMGLTITIPIPSSPGFGFLCERFSEISEYLTICKDLRGMEEDPNYKEEEEEYEEEEENSKIKIKYLTKEETEVYINRLLNDKEFVSTSVPTYRRDYIFELFDNELNPTDIVKLISKTERALEKHLKNKIQELKKKGKRKFEITSELGISKHRVDKYF